MTPLRAVAAGTPGRLSNIAAVSTETIWRAQRTYPRGSDYFSCSGDALNDSRLQARVVTESFSGRWTGKYSQPLRIQAMFWAVMCAKFGTSTNAVQRATTDAAGGIKGEGLKTERRDAFRCCEGKTARWTQACPAQCPCQKANNQSA